MALSKFEIVLNVNALSHCYLVTGLKCMFFLDFGKNFTIERSPTGKLNIKIRFLFTIGF